MSNSSDLQDPSHQLRALLDIYGKNWSYYINNPQNEPVKSRLTDLQDTFFALSWNLLSLDNQMPAGEMLFLGRYLARNMHATRKALCGKGRIEARRTRLKKAFNSPFFTLLEKLAGKEASSLKDQVSRSVIDRLLRPEETRLREDLREWEQKYQSMEQDASTALKTPVAQAFWNTLADLTRRETCFKFRNTAPQQIREEIRGTLR